MIWRKLTIGLLAMTLPSCQTATYEAINAGTKSAMSSVPVETIGIGKYSYRFTLQDTRSDEPLPNHPFALTTFNNSKYQPKIGADGSEVYEGITDKNGQTPTFQLNDKIPDKDFDLRERFGSGANGVTFRVVSERTGKAAPQEKYFIAVCSQPMEYYSGYTDKNGDTGLVLSSAAVHATVYVGERDEEFNYRKDCDDASAKKL